MAGGFVYYVSLNGVTGAGNLEIDSVKKHVTTLNL
jgi:tryptophan synthase alpha subunit